MFKRFMSLFSSLCSSLAWLVNREISSVPSLQDFTYVSIRSFSKVSRLKTTRKVTYNDEHVLLVSLILCLSTLYFYFRFDIVVLLCVLGDS